MGTHPVALYSSGSALGVVDLVPGAGFMRVRLYQLQESSVRALQAGSEHQHC